MLEKNNSCKQQHLDERPEIPSDSSRRIGTCCTVVLDLPAYMGKTVKQEDLLVISGVCLTPKSTEN